MVISLLRSVCSYRIGKKEKNFKKQRSTHKESGMTKLYRILAVCTGNVCRSPMVEGFLKAQAQETGMDHVVVESAGIHAVDDLTPTNFAIEAAAELGVDIRNYRSVYLTRDLVEEANIILVMEKAHVTHIQSHWPKESAGKVKLIRTWHPFNPSESEIKDPMGSNLIFYRRTAKLLKECCEGLMELL